MQPRSPRMRAIPKHELVGMGCTTSQLTPREWRPIQSPRKKYNLPSSLRLPVRSPHPKHVAEKETTASLLMLSGPTMVRVYRELIEFEKSNAQRPALEGGSVFTEEHMRKICALYQQVCEEDSPGLVTCSQLQAIIRGAVMNNATDEKYTPRLFRLRNPHESGRVDFPKFMIEFMMPVKSRPGTVVTPMDKLRSIFSVLSIEPRPEGAELPLVPQADLQSLLAYAHKVVKYYLEWADQVFASMEGTRIHGLSARHRMILMRTLPSVNFAPLSGTNINAVRHTLTFVRRR